MRRFVLLIAFIFVIFAVLVTAVRKLGQQIATPSFFSTIGLGTCENVPCLLGVKPYTTQWAEVRAKAAEFTNVERLGSGIIIRFDVPMMFTFSYQRNTDTVAGVQIFFKNYGKANISALIEEYGLPCAVSYDDITDTLFLYYRFFFATAIENDQSRTQRSTVTMDWPLAHIYFYEGELGCPSDTKVKVTKRGFLTPWLGFTSLQRYESYAGKREGQKH